MRIIDLIRLIFDNLRRQKGRVVLTALGVVIGTASIVILVSLASGLQQNVMKQFGGIGALTTVRVMMNYDMMGPGGGGGGKGSTTNQPQMITNSTIREIESIPGVEAVVARVWLEAGGIIRVGRMEVYPSMVGINTDDASILDLPMDKGSTQLKRGSAIVGGWIAKNFYDPKARPGSPPPEQPQIFDQRVKLTLTKYTADGQNVNKDVDIKVTGLTQEVMGEYDYMIIVPMADIEAWNEWSRGKRINRNMEGYPELFIKTDDMDHVLEVADKIKKMGFQTSTPLEYVRQIQSTFTLMQIVFGGIGAISLLVAAIGIANTMTMAILERTREIGLMKAIGATNRDILSIFLGESASIGLAGGVTGAGLGWIMSRSFDQVLGRAFSGILPINPDAMQNVAQTPLWLIIFVIVFATLIGLLSGLYPSVRAAMMEPVVALKYE